MGSRGLGISRVGRMEIFPPWKPIVQALILVAQLTALAWTPASAVNGNTAVDNQEFLVVADQTTLTVALEDADLLEVLKSIAGQAGFRIETIGKNKERKLTEQFDDVPIAEGLDQLLRDVNYAIVYSDTESPRRIERIFLFSDKNPSPVDPSVSTREAPMGGATQGQISPPGILTPEQIVVDPDSGRTLNDDLQAASELQTEIKLPNLLELKPKPSTNPENKSPPSIESLMQSGTLSLPEEIEHLLGEETP